MPKRPSSQTQDRTPSSGMASFIFAALVTAAIVFAGSVTVVYALIGLLYLVAYFG